MCLPLFRPFLQLSLAFLLPLSERRGEHRELSTQSSPFFIQSPPFSRIFSRVLPRASPGTPTLCHSLHFSSPSAVDNRSETHKFHLLMHHILRRRCAFPPSAVAKFSHFSSPCAPRLVFSPPSLSKFSFNSSDPSSHVHLLRSLHPQLPSPTGHQPDFPPLIGDTFARHDTKAHNSHNNSMPFLPFCHSNSIFVV